LRRCEERLVCANIDEAVGGPRVSIEVKSADHPILDDSSGIAEGTGQQMEVAIRWAKKLRIEDDVAYAARVGRNAAMVEERGSHNIPIVLAKEVAV